jgi:hypothetical protein
MPVIHFSFQATGKEVTVPLDTLPPLMPDGMPEYVSVAIGLRTLDSRDAIVNFVWDCFEHDMLVQDREAKAKRQAGMQAMIQNGPQPILIPRELVPEEYWNGLPQNLKLLLDGLSDPRQIIGMILAYDSSEKARKRTEQDLARYIATNQARFRPPGVRQPAPNPVEEQNRRLLEQAEADREARERANTLSQMRIRFVPSSIINSLQGMPGLPPIPFDPQQQQFPLGLQPTSIQKGPP